MARDMVRGGSGNNLDNPTRQTGRVFFISRRNYDRAIQLEHPCSVSRVNLTIVCNVRDDGSQKQENFRPQLAR